MFLKYRKKKRATSEKIMDRDRDLFHDYLPHY